MSRCWGALSLKKQSLESRPGCVLSALGMVFTWLALSGCGDTKVVAEVGRSKLRRADVEFFRQTWSPGARPSASEALGALVDQQLLAEEARREGLEKDEVVRARLAAVEREVLAHALREKRLAEAESEVALRERYARGREGLSRRQVHVRHLMVRLPPREGAQGLARARSRINGLYARLLGGESFEVVAREGSEDRVSAEKGGDLGLVEEGQVDASFFAEAVALKKGQLSKPFATSYGLHLVEAVEDVRVVTPGFDEVRGRLAAEARREAETRLLTELRENIAVQTYPERLEVPAVGSGSATDAGETP
ncbi:hypothetical protein CYFUS_004322 [Cystobacter fuscus]|uniref:PpiC domain-containing protein n=1 Tax=Cystobacter fuscus TaxID=43 RepID=A0A250J4K6_9BACT|nr:peptidylprolyl isomerase [Cystobacter fuscus]ATB38885.1 hypothetical protein CYFUS_004322 [Cystobacter fuscus]